MSLPGRCTRSVEARITDDLLHRSIHGPLSGNLDLGPALGLTRFGEKPTPTSHPPRSGHIPTPFKPQQKEGWPVDVEQREPW